MARFTNTDWPQRLWVVRHGQSAGNVARDAAESGGLALIDLQSRDADTPLSALGERQSAALASWFSDSDGALRPEVFLTSPFARSRQTVDAIAAALDVDTTSVQADERLREKEFGILDRLRSVASAKSFRSLPRSAPSSASSTSDRRAVKVGAT